ncbi:DUF5412 family protein [Sporosarcina sp. FSL K6-2383]|uniref:DUF5412 family protein n=1 Tax=Sporosarcina sp. FSL K6-2383 TaxID=2921556 RepID=UPI00315A08B7
MRKILKITLKILGIMLLCLIGIIVLFFLTIHSLFAGACANEVLSANDSPNGTYTAYVFTRDCGATTSVSYQLSILKKDQILKNKNGNTFVSEKEFDVEWTDDRQLTVYPTSAKTIKMKNKRGKVSIVYPTK